MTRGLTKIAGFAIPITLAAFTASYLVSTQNRSPSPAASCSSCTQTPSRSTEKKTLKVVAGISYDFSPKAALTPGGTWTCEYGTIGSSGHYSAPEFQPPWGEDYITYIDPNGVASSVEVLVVANAQITDSAYPKYIEVPRGWSASTDPDPTASVHSGANGAVIHTGNLAAVHAAYPTLPVYEYGTVPPAAPAVVSCEPTAVPPPSEIPLEETEPEIPVIGRARAGSATGTTLIETAPVIKEAAEDLLIEYPSTLPVASQPLLCVLGPVNPIPSIAGTNCSGSVVPVRVVSHESPMTGPRRIGSPSAGSVEFSYETDSQLKGAGLGSLATGFEIGVVYPTSRRLQQWSQKKKEDIYVCVNGKWKFIGSQTCSRTGNGEFVTPLWLAVIDGYGVNGEPGPNTWGSWQCR